MPLVSFLIPTYKEDRIGDSVDEIASHLAEIPNYTFEILLIDDSSEKYKDQIRRYIADRERMLGPNIRVILVDGVHKGKGSAIRLGALSSRGDIVFTMDADLPIPLVRIADFLQILNDPSVDVVIAERPFNRNLRNPLRYVLSKGLFFLQRVLVFQSNQFLDTQCGFKAYRGDLIRSIAARQIVDGGMYDIEYLYMAVLGGRHIARRTIVANKETRSSKIRAWKCMFSDPLDLIRVKAMGIRNRYELPEAVSLAPSSAMEGQNGARFKEVVEARDGVKV